MLVLVLVVVVVLAQLLTLLLALAPLLVLPGVGGGVPAVGPATAASTVVEW